MPGKSLYPNIGLRSKSELAKRIAGKDFPYKDALALINDVASNFDKYWKDNAEMSKPLEHKHVRSAARTPLGKLLKLIDRKVLVPHDSCVPDFMFGGLSKRNHIQAGVHLLGQQRRRTLQALDISRFFERIHEERVFHFFNKKCGCSVAASRLLASLCCVPTGIKGSGSDEKTIARGFATSSRLALWCNLGTFQRISWKVAEELKGHDPRIAIYVDDVGITASNISEQEMKVVGKIVADILANFDPKQPLPVNVSKSRTSSYESGMQHLGLKLGRRKMSMGWKSRGKKDSIKEALKHESVPSERRKLLQKKRAYYVYERQIKKAVRVN